MFIKLKTNELFITNSSQKLINLSTYQFLKLDQNFMVSSLHQNKVINNDWKVPTVEHC